MCERALYESADRINKTGDKYQSNWGTLMEYVDMTAPNIVSYVLMSSLAKQSEKSSLSTSLTSPRQNVRYSN